MEEQTEQSNDATELSVPQQETTFEEEETSPPQGTSTDPLTQIADALNKLLVARSPREIDVSPYDGTFEAQSFFDNFDAQADRAKLTYTDRLHKLPCYLQGKPLQYFRNLRLDRLFYIDVRQTLIDLFPTATEASFSRFLAIKLTLQMPLEDYYQNKTVMGMKLNLPADILIDSLTEGLPVADQRLIATVQPKTIKEWFDLVSRIRRTQCATSAVYQRQVDKAPHPTYHNPPPRHNNQRSSRVTYQVAPPPSPCKYCNAMHWHSQCEQRFQQDQTRQVYSARPRTATVPKSGTRPKVQSRSPVPQVQDDSTSPASNSTFTKCKQDLCPTQPRETAIFTTFPSNQSCLHVADPTPIICSLTIVSPTISPTHDIESSIPSNATPQLEHCPHELHRILYEFSHVFSTNKYNVPKLNIPPVKINTTTDKIIALRPYRVPLHDQQEIQTQIEQMLQHGIIAPSVSPYASPITLVTKRDKTKRFCIDYRKLNEIIAPDVHPLPLIETILDKLSKAKYYSSVDIASAYWQVEVEPNSRNLLAFVTLDSQYEFCRLPYGFKNSPQIYHRAINQVMQKYKLNFVTHYFDDFIIFSDTLEDHLQHLQQFLTVCQHENIKLNYNKCSFFKTNIDFLGYTVTAGTYAPQTRNLDTISAIKPPTNQKTLQSFLGAVNVYNKFIPDYARLRAPLNKLLKKDVKWNWDPDCQQAFTTLKESLTSKPVLHLYQVGLPCRLYCDASTQGIAGILKQVHPDGQVHPVQYFSRALRAHERNYTVSELECLAIVESVDKFRIYLTGIKFTIYTDHQALQWLKTIKNPSGRLFRWSLRLSTYNYEIHYLKGSQQYEADLLSRNPFVGFVSADIIKQHQPTASPFNIDTNGLHTITRKGVIKIIIPETLQHTLMNKVHQEYNHPGISQMTRIITTQYYWKGISKSIEKFVKSCHTCQIIKRPKGKPYGALGQIPPPQQPFDLISIDTIAGFSKYGHSKTYLHVIVDHLTRYAWTFPSKSTSTLTYIQTLKTVLQQGSPKRLLSDRAPAFTSEKFRKFLITHGIQPLLTTSNNPQANGLIERLNATITGKLRLAYLENPKASWTQLVKRVTQTYNNTPHSVTSFPPTYLMFNVIPPDLRTHLNPYPEINIAREIANSRTQNKHKRDKETFDKQHRTPHFEVNDLVLVKNYRHPDTAGRRVREASVDDLPTRGQQKQRQGLMLSPKVIGDRPRDRGNKIHTNEDVQSRNKSQLTETPHTSHSKTHTIKESQLKGTNLKHNKIKIKKIKPMVDISKNERFMYWNINGFFRINSLFPLFEYLKQFEMFALTETWCHFNIDLNLANFGMYQSPAVKSSDKGRGSGGIILGINKQLQPQIDNVEIETSWIAVTLNPSLDNDSPAICVIFVYIPPNYTHATKLGRLFHLMENKIYNGFEIILVGDLNVRIGNLGGYHNLIDTSNLFSTTRNSCDLTKSAKAEIFIDFLDKNHLTIINGRSINDKSGKFTFISGRGSSVLDLAIVSPAVLEHIADFEIGCMPYSDHLPIILKFIGPNNKTKNCYMEPKAKIKFSWSVDKIPTYIETLKELTPEHPADSTIDTQAEDFTGLIQTAMLRSGTRMEAKTKNIKSKPWFDKDFYLAKKEMKQNLKLYVKHNISADKIAYLSSKKKYSAILKLKKREYTDKIQVILSNVKDPSQFWKTINSLKYRNNLQGEISTADWQVFYRELLGSNLTKVVQLPLEILDIDPELDCEISLTEVTKEISKLGKNKATGLDEIPNEAIKYLLEEHTIYLRNLFNKILGTSQVPQQWTKTIIHPIFKNGDPDNPSNYRGISLISNLSKLFTSILKTRLNDWMERKSILAENQAGFRKGYSCQDHIFTLVSLIQMTLSRRRGKLYAFFIDLRKAFDTVPHHLLWKKLALNGLSCRFIKLIKNYYSQMTATVRWRGSFTEAIKIQAGVLQGEPLSPYLFILFLNDLVHLFDESELPGINLENYGTIHLLLYADDIVILGESKINLQLKINLLKKNGGRTAHSETWFWGQQPLTIVAKYTYLGYPLTTKISTQYASQYFRNKALNAINALWRILTKARIKSFTSVMKLLDTIVLPTLLYAAPMWAINQLKTVNNTQDTFLRRLLDLPNFTPGYVLRRECGRISTELNAVKLTLKFWVRILKMETSRLPHACLNYLWKVTAKKEIENSFTQNLIKILDSKGYSFLKGCEDYLAIQKELPGIIRTTTDQLIQNDQMKITDSTHFAHYKFLSESFMTEEYLRLNISLPNKRLVAQHRVLWQFFREERKDFWKENGRNCLLCKDLMDDNLVHYFFQCPLLTEKRTDTFPSPTSGQFRYHSICQLLSSDLNDKLLIDKYFKFCTEAGRMRKNAGQRILEDDPSVNRDRGYLPRQYPNYGADKKRKYQLLAREMAQTEKMPVKVVPIVLTWDGIVTKYNKQYRKEINIRKRDFAYIQSLVLKKTMEIISTEKKNEPYDKLQRNKEMEAMDRLLERCRELACDDEEGGTPDMEHRDTTTIEEIEENDLEQITGDLTDKNGSRPGDHLIEEPLVEAIERLLESCRTSGDHNGKGHSTDQESC
ncbi:K02A2.6-like [Cordylochernes scorpioides]|uniref:RNA-directed DNA polymerase n=1 Tax=Cordylochernes scorpioides TaxID=51811 RepID=A0ABY6L2F3_9ARAC|nr:K02A2.6-like [Cordylochernes scorpioides]